jgi:hypothetical protein
MSDSKADFTGFQDMPMSDLSAAAAAMLSAAAECLGEDTRIVIFAVRDDPEDNSFENIGGAFGGFKDPVQMLEWMLREWVSMVARLPSFPAQAMLNKARAALPPDKPADAGLN